MQSSQPTSVYKNFKYRVTADLICLRLARTGFNYKIQWKRRQNKAETRIIHHDQTQSFINEKLTLDFNLQYDTRKGKFLEKNIDFLPTIVTETGLRSGGYGRIDLSEALNNGQARIEKIIPLAQCPDPNATIEVTLTYINMGQTNQIQDSIIMNASMDVGHINSKEKVEKFKTLSPQPVASSVSPRHFTGNQEQTHKQIQQLQSKLQSYQTRQRQLVTENARHVAQLQNLQKSSQAKDLELSNKAREILSLKEVHKQVQKAQQELREKDELIRTLNAKVSQLPAQSVSQTRGDSRNAQQDLSHKVQELEKINVELQGQLSQSNMRLAQIFNAAIEHGGPNLLDTLQNSIGMND